MMKKPTTKKLPEKQVARTVTAKGKPFMKLFSDEKFYQYPPTSLFLSTETSFLLLEKLLICSHSNMKTIIIYLSGFVKKERRKNFTFTDW